MEATVKIPLLLRPFAALAFLLGVSALLLVVAVLVVIALVICALSILFKGEVLITKERAKNGLSYSLR